jgi:hypothetical protein
LYVLGETAENYDKTSVFQVFALYVLGGTAENYDKTVDI